MKFHRSRLKYVGLLAVAMLLCGTSGRAEAAKVVEDFSSDTVGSPPTTFATPVGAWMIGADGDKQVLISDGSKWDGGANALGMMEQLKSLYGERYAEFVDTIPAFSYYPYAVAKNVDNFSEGTISVRFKAVAGEAEQAAGLIFNIKPNGDYLILRGNPLENNLILFKYEQGERTSLKWIRNVPIASVAWHDLKAVVTGTRVNGWIDGIMLIDYTLDEPVSGKVGLWTKSDTVAFFTDFLVETPG